MSKRCLSKVLVCILEIIVLTIFLFYLPVTYADAQTRISIDPNFVVVQVGETLTANVTINDVVGLRLWQIVIEYNSTVLNFTAAWLPENHIFKDKNFFSSQLIFKNTSYGACLSYGATLIGWGEGVDVEGTEILCSMNFTVETIGQSYLRITTEEHPATAPGSTQLPDGTWTNWALWSYLKDFNMVVMDFEEESGVVAAQGIPIPPRAVFSVSPLKFEHENAVLIGNTTYFVNERIIFNASASYDPDGYIVSYEWNFGDGNITTVDKPIVYHTYNRTHLSVEINLRVLDNDGLVSEVSPRMIRVGIILTPLDVMPYAATLTGLVALMIVAFFIKRIRGRS